MTGAATQRRRLAILALLAVARERGMSRDKLLDYLWSESDTDRARHNLNQLLHAERRHFGSPDLFAGVKSLRLNPEVIWTDVGEFEAALERDALEEAVALYRGPFLDGFFVSHAPEFERWVASRRDEFALRCRDALVGLAGRASAAGDATATVEWWRRAFDLDPLDSAVAGSLVRALSHAGDRPGALRYARRHAERLRDELDVAPDPEFLRLMGELGDRRSL